MSSQNGRIIDAHTFLVTTASQTLFSTLAYWRIVSNPSLIIVAVWGTDALSREATLSKLVCALLKRDPKDLYLLQDLFSFQSIQ